MVSFLMVLLSLNSGGERVARIAGRTIISSDIPVKTSLDAYLKRLVFFEIAKEKGFDDSVRAGVEQRFQESMVKGLYNKVIKAAKVNSAEPYILYRLMRKEVKTNLILTKDFRSAYKAWCEVMRGRDFREVSEEYSTDIKLKNKKGDIGWLRWNYNPTFLIRKAFRMKKWEVSFPFRTRDGWNVIKVIEVKSRDLQDYSNMEKGLSNQIQKMKVGVFSNRHLTYLKWILNVEVEPDAFAIVSSRMPPSRGRQAQKPEFGLEDMNKILARSNLGLYKVKDFSDAIKNMPRMPRVNNKKDMESFIEWRILFDFLILESKRLGIHRKPNFRSKFRDELINTTVRQWKAYEIEPLTHLTEEEKKQYFEENKEKYEIPEKRKVYIIRVKTKEEAEEIRKKLLKGKDFEKLASLKSIGREKDKKGLLGYIQENENDAISKEAFALKLRKISKPFKADENWAVIKVTDIKKSVIPEYSKLRYRISKDCERDRREEVENRIFEENKDRFGLEIFKDEKKEDK